MKRLVMFVVLSSFVLFFNAENFCKDFPESKKKSIVTNLIEGINSENTGLRVSAALRVIELIQQEHLTKEDFSSAVIPLMKMLRKGKSELEKIAAALSLYQIEDERGIYQLRGAAKYDDSDKVRMVGKNLYFQFHSANDTTYLIDY